MKALGIFFGILLAIALTILWYFSENIKGYYKFKEYCEKDAGLRIYEPLEKNVGWVVQNKHEALLILNMEDVAYARYADDKTKVVFDVYHKGGDKGDESSYDFKESDGSNNPIYILKSDVNKNYVPFNPSFLSYEIINIETQSVNVSFKKYHYSFFNTEKTPMGVTEKFVCSNNVIGSNLYWLDQIKKSFHGQEK